MNLVDVVKRHEGFRSLPYKDTTDHLTVGYGHNLDEPMSNELAEIILHYDLTQALRSARSLAYYDSLDQVRKDAILNMIFNLGKTKFLGFKRMNAAFHIGDYSLAATEALDSKWAREDVGQRAVEIANQIRTGEYAE